VSSLAHPLGTLSKAGTTVGGMAAILLKSATGVTVAVAAHGTPFPLEIVSPGSGSLTFTDWNKPVTVKKPASYINVAQLGS
jgi:hypothetical protein